MATAVESKPNVVFIVGGPGAGKGTQCDNLIKEFGFIHLSAGDLLRAEVKSGSERGKMIEGLMKQGKIVPSEITIELMKKKMDENPKCKFFIIDGFPRNIEQGDMFERDIVPCKFLLNLDCPESVMESRLLKRKNESTVTRPDDNEATIRLRFQTHQTTCIPVLEHYKKKDKLVQVDASKSVEQVYHEVRKLFLK